VYRIEQKLGRVFRELEPYALFPVNEYFHGPSKDVSSCLEERVVPIPIRPGRGQGVRVPSQRTA
jgi:hypothetical protein